MLRLILPLIAEQTLAVTIGMLDTVMVSYAGESAISGVSLVDQISILLINIFSALTTGGAVVAAQYMGRGDRKNAGRSAKQLFWLSGSITSVIMAVCLIFNHGILRTIYGAVEPDVMSSAEIYFYITCVSYPALGIYNSGAALFRSMGNSQVSMKTSLIMNLMNLGGNALLIYGFGMGAAGAAWSTLASRTVGAVIMLILMCRPTGNLNEFRVEKIYKPETDFGMIKSILRIGVPNGAEGGMFQVGKLIVANLITTFGTASIAANAVSNTLAGFSIIPGSAIGLAMITVVGQCVGAGDYDQAKRYTLRLMKYVYMICGAVDLVMFFAGPAIVSFFNISAEAKEMAQYIVRTYAVASFLIWSLSFSLPNALRAAGDARFTMIIAILSMWIFRIGFSYLLCVWFGMGLNGVWYAMYIDWIFRSSWYVWRFLSGRWKYKKVIS
ncbi:MAG: MATE family efflux transporter [Clostridiales bacterium]|nr:MATE family efflux transporter [Clostridiales bacterium]